MKYTFLIDAGELLTEDKEFDTDEQALAYGQNLFDHCNAPSITVINQDGKRIGELD